jgi:hypothetical protein
MIDLPILIDRIGHHLKKPVKAHNESYLFQAYVKPAFQTI